MTRRAKVIKRQPMPDGRFGSIALSKFVNCIMERGKKSTAEHIVYGALGKAELQVKRPPMEIFEQAIRNVTPIVEVKPRRVGGATYQVPVEIRGDRRIALAYRWLIKAARARSGKTMADKLASEVLDAYHNTGTAVKKREDTHRMADANKAFSHYRW